jgi:putative transposase
MASLQTKNHAAFSLHYHVILTTKYRRPCIHRHILCRLETILGELCQKWRCQLIEFGGETDHVHLLIQAHPALNLADMIANLKTVSSRLIRKEFSKDLARYYWKPYLWNKAYAVVSAGGHASIDVLMKYIQNQETPPK